MKQAQEVDPAPAVQEAVPEPGITEAVRTSLDLPPVKYATATKFGWRIDVPVPVGWKDRGSSSLNDIDLSTADTRTTVSAGFRQATGTGKKFSVADRVRIEKIRSQLGDDPPPLTDGPTLDLGGYPNMSFQYSNDAPGGVVHHWHIYVALSEQEKTYVSFYVRSYVRSNEEDFKKALPILEGVRISPAGSDTESAPAPKAEPIRSADWNPEAAVLSGPVNIPMGSRFVLGADFKSEWQLQESTANSKGMAFKFLRSDGATASVSVNVGNTFNPDYVTTAEESLRRSLAASDEKVTIQAHGRYTNSESKRTGAIFRVLFEERVLFGEGKMRVIHFGVAHRKMEVSGRPMTLTSVYKGTPNSFDGQSVDALMSSFEVKPADAPAAESAQR
jgi:hypothetical protein